MTQEPLVELRGADLAREEDPERVVLRGVDWSIHGGEWWAISGGPSTGKTALLLAAAGLNPPARGDVTIFGRRLREASEAEQTRWRREIGFVWEAGGSLLGRLTVAENVGLAVRYHENLAVWEARERVAGLLALAGLEAVADDLPSRIGPAMRGRVALLRALASPIRLLFLDDPVRGLAPGDVRWWRAFLGELRASRAREGRPLAVVTSAFSADAWREEADRLGVIEGDRFVVGARRDVAERRGDA